MKDKSEKTKRSVELFTQTAWSARVWFSCTLILFVLLLLQPYLLKALEISSEVAKTSNERYIVLDGAGNFTISHAKEFSVTQETHEYISILATQALLSRNPKGLDFPDLAERLYSKTAFETIKEEEKETLNLFSANELHAKPEIEKITIRKVADEAILSAIEGAIVRNGNFKGELYTETFKFRLKCVLKRNPNLLTNKRFPVVVTNYKLETFNEKGELI